MQKILTSRVFIFVEFIVLCIGLPAYIIETKSAPFMFSFLWGATLYGFIILRLVYHDHLRDIWKWQAVTWENLKIVLGRWILACVLMTGFLYLYDPDRMFSLLLNRPLFLPVLFVLYPLVSALPQEFIFCSFIFERYKIFFGQGLGMVLVSAVIFAYAHLLYINPVAPALSLIAGLIFAMTYLKTRSLALVTIEHGLYGNYLFFVGLGWYFYSGGVAQ